ncbi:Ferrochelatase-1, chloroplastic/mitochondrial [Linum perenne]
MEAASISSALPQTKLSVASPNFSRSCSKAGAVQSVSYLSSGRSLPRDNLSSRVLSVGGLDRRRNVVTQSYAAPPASICPFDETSAVQNRTRTTEEKIGVLLLNLGGPESLNDVQPFLFNLFADPDIIRLPRLFQFLQRPLAQLISTLRAPKSKEGYAAIGGGSPLRKITDEQAYAIKDALQAKDVSVDVYVGMRYCKKDRITKLVVLPLYPQFSISTTGSSLRVLQSIFRCYVKSMADLIEEELQTFSKPDEVPVSYVEEAGDPYRDQMEDCIYLIMQELKARGVYNDHTLAYQSRVGPVQWLKPYTDEVLVELGKKGVKSLLAVPTLEEIDMEYRELALESGIENWGRVPALGCTTSFITDLADAVVEALPSAKAIVSSSDSAEEADDYDPFRYAIKLVFGSVVAFLLLFSPKMFVAFRKQLL